MQRSAASVGPRSARSRDHHSRRPQVVVVGGGFAGVAAVRALRHAPVVVTLVDPAGAQTFQPLLYQVATGVLAPGDVQRPHERLRREPHGRHRHGASVRTVRGGLAAVDTARRTVAVTTAEGTLALRYDTLVLAAGTVHRPAPAPGLTTVHDALAIRDLLADAVRTGSPVTVVGAGPTGVELAGQVAELLPRGRVTLLEAGPHILPDVPPAGRAAAVAALRRSGVDVRTDAPVRHVDDAGVVLDSGVIPGRAVWAAGVVVAPAVALVAGATGAPVDALGRIRVRPDLTVPGHPEIFVVGDAATLPGVPGLAPAAMQTGRYAGRRIAARLGGPRLGRLLARRPFRYFDKGDMAVVTSRWALARLGPGPLPRWVRVPLRGPAAMALWLGVHAFYLPGRANRAVAVTRWLPWLTSGHRAHLPAGTPSGAAAEGAPEPVAVG